MSNNGSFAKLAVIMLCGALIGGCTEVIMLFGRKGIDKISESFGNTMLLTGVIAETALVTAAAIGIIIIYRHLVSLAGKEAEAEDEEADRYGELFEKWAQIGHTVSNTGAMVILLSGCMLFPNGMKIQSDKEAAYFLLLAVDLVAGTALMAVMEILLVRLMQKRDPQKMGDPSDFNFNKKWLEGCDETEKLVIYQAGYKAFGVMQGSIFIALILCIVGKANFGTGNFPLVILGIVMLGGNVVYGYWGLKGLKKRRTL